MNLPRNQTNNVTQIPLNGNHIVQFKEGRSRRLVTPNTMRHMFNAKTGKYVSALSRAPIENFRVRRVRYRNNANKKNNNKNVQNRIRNAAKKQENLRKGKELLPSFVHQNARRAQINQNAILARRLNMEMRQQQRQPQLAEFRREFDRMMNRSRRLRAGGDDYLADLVRAEAIRRYYNSLLTL